MSLRQLLTAGHFMRQAFDSETIQRHSQLILQLTALFTVDSSAKLDAVVNCHGLKLFTGTLPTTTYSHHQENHNMWRWSSEKLKTSESYLFPARSIQISLFIRCGQP
uniref:Uncharacterized protein n=1 Tax=Setaria italica TaxID=4555 RepID=K3XNG5_SETIT